jgi:pimeloyl-ACP methyl ester carboxylesterase
VATPWAENNVVFGKLYRAGRKWQERPSVILLHGWNGELGYRWQFPWLAWRLVRSGVNAAMIELPYHNRRKPCAAGAITNFISHDLLRMVEATQQAVADTRALMGWLLGEGSPVVGLWGLSLGGWLAGLVACHDARARFAVLMTPVVRMDRAVRDLAFCEPIRRSLEGTSIRLDPLNLASHFPRTGPETILLVESQHDLFAPPETIEELWSAWRRPEIWRLKHGHISILISLPVMERTVKWIARKAAANGRQ